VARAFWGDPAEGVQFWAGHTFGGNPVACAVGTAAVRYLLDHGLVANADVVGGYLAGRLRDLADGQPAISEIRGLGMLRSVAFNEPIGKAVYGAARRRGLLLRPGADWVGVAPPLCTTREEADEIVALLAGAVEEVAA
jgi:adenosylmethionine-8-amino-7-oxononanoate aminotransferase